MEITKEAYSEVYAILNLMSWDLIKKIPENIWENIEKKRNKEQVTEINNIKVLYKNYFANDEEKEAIQAKEKILYERQQEELREKYNPDNLFKNKEIKTKTEDIVSVVPYKKTFFTRIRNWFKNIFSN